MCLPAITCSFPSPAQPFPPQRQYQKVKLFILLFNPSITSKLAIKTAPKELAITFYLQQLFKFMRSCQRKGLIHKQLSDERHSLITFPILLLMHCFSNKIPLDRTEYILYMQPKLPVLLDFILKSVPLCLHGTTLKCISSCKLIHGPTFQ